VSNLKVAGVPTEIIMQATGLSREEVDEGSNVIDKPFPT
jgi:hypothetical protein